MVHDVTTSPGEYWPGAQLMHLQSSLYSPALHTTKKHELEAGLELWPKAQREQSLAPPVEYVTAAQVEHLAAAAWEYLPAPQITHWVPPVESLYVLAAHCVHWGAFAPE